VRRSLLHQHLALGVEEENAEGSVQFHILRLWVHPVAVRLGGCADSLVVGVHQDALLLEGLCLEGIVHGGLRGHLPVLLPAHRRRGAAAQPGRAGQQET